MRQILIFQNKTTVCWIIYMFFKICANLKLFCFDFCNKYNFTFALLFTNLKKCVNQHCRPLEILRKIQICLVLIQLYVFIEGSTVKAGTRHRRSKDDSRDCEPITDPNIEIEVIRAGRDINDNSATHTRGSVLKVYCSSGFDLNLPKRKIRCKRGEWKPEMPICR